MSLIADTDSGGAAHPQDGEWGKDAIMNMVEIYLNPDNQDIFQESTEAKGTLLVAALACSCVVRNVSPAVCAGDNAAYLEAAEKLLGELTSMGDNSPK